MRTCCLFLLLCLLPGAETPAGTITLSGSIRHRASLAPVDSAEVTILEDGAGTPVTLAANALGQWSYTLTTTAVGGENTTPESFVLGQNYPNPFNPSTHIPFTLPASGRVTVTVHTALGQRLDERSYDLDAGSHAVSWTASGAAGVLFYTVATGTTRRTGKMVQLDGHGPGGLGDALTSGLRRTTSALARATATGFTIITSRILYMPDTTRIETATDITVDTRLDLVHERAFVFDLHNDVMEKAVNGYDIGVRHTVEQSDIPRFRDGGVDAQMFALWTDYRDSIAHPWYAYTMEMADTFMAQVGRNSHTIVQARTHDEIMAAHAAGKIAAVLCVEGGHSIENDLGKLRTLYDRGARYLTITWNNSLPWAVAAADARSTTVGLSDFGRTVIRTMDTLGMIVDVSHTGVKTIEDILATTKHPIIASHSGARALRNHTRNLTDAQIDSIAGRGGVIGVVFYPPFLAASGTVTVETVMKHIDYIRNRAGIDHVAIGSDFDGIEVTPVGLESVAKMPAVTAALLRRGYSIPDVFKILGGNYLRVFRQVCR